MFLKGKIHGLHNSFVRFDFDVEPDASVVSQPIAESAKDKAGTSASRAPIKQRALSR